MNIDNEYCKMAQHEVTMLILKLGLKQHNYFTISLVPADSACACL